MTNTTFLAFQTTHTTCIQLRNSISIIWIARHIRVQDPFNMAKLTLTSSTHKNLATKICRHLDSIQRIQYIFCLQAKILSRTSIGSIPGEMIKSIIIVWEQFF